MFLLPTNHDFARWKQYLFNILLFEHLKKIILKHLVELPINTTFHVKFSFSTVNEWNLAYNKN